MIVIPTVVTSNVKPTRCWEFPTIPTADFLGCYGATVHFLLLLQIWTGRSCVLGQTLDHKNQAGELFQLTDSVTCSDSVPRTAQNMLALQANKSTLALYVEGILKHQ